MGLRPRCLRPTSVQYAAKIGFADQNKLVQYVYLFLRHNTKESRHKEHSCTRTHLLKFPPLPTVSLWRSSLEPLGLWEHWDLNCSMMLWFISIALNEALLRLQVNPGNNCHSVPSLFQLTQYPQHFCSVFYRDLHFLVCDSLKFSIVFFFSISVRNFIDIFMEVTLNLSVIL